MSDQHSSTTPSSTLELTYTPSVQSTTSYQSTKSLLSPSSSTSSSKTFKTKAKKFLFSLGDPPTMAYDREQEAKKGVDPRTQTHMSKDGKQAFGAVNYGPYRTSTFGGERSLGRI